MDYRSKEAAEYRRWYGLAAWRGKNGRRAHQLQAEPLCRFCLAAGEVVAADTVDHVQAHKGDPALFWEGDLQSLCKTCHDSSKQQIEAHGYHDRCDAQGYPLDVNHPANKRRS